MLFNRLILLSYHFAGLRNSSFDFVFRTNETQYCFELEVVTFRGPVDFYQIAVNVTTPGNYVYDNAVNLLIYEAISYGRQKKEN